MHPRDQNREPNFQGRIRVQLRNDDGSFCDEKFTSRKLFFIGMKPLDYFLIVLQDAN